MALRVYILGDAAAYQNYTLAVERAGNGGDNGFVLL